MASLDEVTRAPKLIPTLLDEVALLDPEKPFAEIPISPTGYGLGTRKITYRKLANAVNAISHWLINTLGPGKNFPTISYLGPNDLSHNIVLIASIKAGYKLLLTSPRYGTIGQARLMKETQCSHLLISSASPSTPATAIAAEHGSLQIWTLPDLAELYDVECEFAYTKTYSQAKDEPLVVIHTSGTSGFPKPILWTHEFGYSFGRQRELRPPVGFELLDTYMTSTRMLSMCPPFHAGLLFASLFLTFYSGNTIIYPPAGLPASIETAAGVVRNSSPPVECLFLLPVHMDELGGDSALVEDVVCGGVQTVVWAGGSVMQSSIDRVSARLRLFTCLGSTETGMWPSIRHLEGNNNPDDFTSLCFHPQANIEFRRQTDDLYSAVFVRNPSSEDKQSIFCVFPELDEFDTKDLFRLVSGTAEERFWTHHGRSDDLQCFHSGGKWHPVSTERRILAEHPGLIQEVLVIGTGLDKSVVLLEPTAKLRLQLDARQGGGDETTVKVSGGDFMDQIWLTIEGINKDLPVYARVERSRIIVTDVARPMLRTGKGNVQRKQTVQEYEREIQNVSSLAEVQNESY
ncbi:NRPS-like enzyme [Penicillium cataractarum]|uniref:NRPS-like enzyme n=1 Tax=Penicillium cataractarum TaxID=2100454 RepID=A0A9W9VW95_9EURO|nr:NRPS-like enzyme [Penicillium cataractarum]KAJ5390567.1 NRPS-like enzyme [Penicillium cataractarum]